MASRDILLVPLNLPGISRGEISRKIGQRELLHGKYEGVVLVDIRGEKISHAVIGSRAVYMAAPDPLRSPRSHEVTNGGGLRIVHDDHVVVGIK